MAKRKVFIDVTPICRSERSGVSYSLLQLLHAIDNSLDITKEFELIAFAPRSLIERSHVMRQFKNIRAVGIPLPAKLFQIFFRLKLLPPIDLIIGKGLYCFYDYRILPITKSSSALVCIHDLTFLKFPEYLEKRNLEYLRKIVPDSITGARTVICVSEAAKKELANEYPGASDKMIVLYNTLNERAFTRQPDDTIQQAQEKYELPAGPWLLFIGNMEPRKNISSLLDAYEKLGASDNLPPLVLVGAMSWGEGVVKEKINTLRSKGYAITTPSQYVRDEDIPALLSGSYCLVLPSFYEGFGYPPLQAILCGTPAVVSENMPVNELISEYTIKINPHDIDQLSHNLRDIINKGYGEVSIDRERITAAIGYERTATQFLSILRKMTRKRP